MYRIPDSGSKPVYLRSGFRIRVFLRLFIAPESGFTFKNKIISVPESGFTTQNIIIFVPDPDS